MLTMAGQLEGSNATAEFAFGVGDPNIDYASRALKAMGHPLRLKILCILVDISEVSVQELVEKVGTSQSNISQHLSILREKDILMSRKDANKVFYRISDLKIVRLMESMRNAFCQGDEQAEGDRGEQLASGITNAVRPVESSG